MSDFSVFVPISEATPGMVVDLGVLVIEQDCGIVVTGYSDSTHAANYMMIGSTKLEGTENGVSSWTLNLPAGVYPVSYHVGARQRGEQPVGASFDATVSEVACPTTTTTVPEVTTTTMPPVTSTTVPPVTTTVPPSTTTTVPPSTTTTVPPTTTSVPSTSTTVPETTTSVPPSHTLPETGGGYASLTLAAVAAIVLGVYALRSRRLSND